MSEMGQRLSSRLKNSTSAHPLTTDIARSGFGRFFLPETANPRARTLHRSYRLVTV